MGHEGGRIQSFYLCGFGDAFAKNLNLDVTEGGVKSDGHCAGQEQAFVAFVAFVSV